MNNNRKYFLNELYKERNVENYFDDTKYKDEFQDEVYSFAHEILVKNNYNKVLDIGCGSGFKLIKYFKDNNITGLDLEPTVKWLKETYKDINWNTFDELVDFEYDVIICSDVIEHIKDVDVILISLLRKLKFKKLVLSTPERISMYGFDRMEEPMNPSHIREWSFDEFGEYCKSLFDVESHFTIGNTQIIEINNFK